MKSKKLLWIFVFILVSISVNAGLEDEVILYWDFRDGEPLVTDESGNGHDGYIDPAYTEVGNPISGVGLSDVANLGYKINTTSFSSGTITNMSIVLWYNVTEAQTNWFNMYSWGISDANMNFLLRQIPDTNSPLACRLRTSAGINEGYSTSANDNTNIGLHMWSCVWDGTNKRVYVNDTLRSIHAIAGTLSASSWEFSSNPRISHSVDFKGHVYQVIIYGRNLTGSELTELYNSGSGVQLFTAPEPSLTINHNLIANTTVDADELFEEITYNGTVVSTSDLFNCSLFVNRNNVTTINETQALVNMTNLQTFNYSYGFIDDTVYYAIYCNNTDTNDFVGYYDYTVDTTKYINYILNLDIQSTVDEIWGEINMIPIILIWLVLTIGSFILMSGRQYTVGLIIYLYSAIFDLFLTGWIFNTYSSLASTTTYYGFVSAILIVGLTGYTFVKIAIPVYWKRKQNVGR